MTPTRLSAQVVIAGGGPAGLTLAIELGRRGIDCMLLDEELETTRHPQATSTQARTMEHYRRLGFAHEIRALGLPPDYPTDIAYFTRYSRTELGRFRLPASREAQAIARNSSGSWNTPELPHRCPQKLIERVLRKHAAKYATSRIQYGWRVTGFRDLGTHVEVDAESVSGAEAVVVSCDYLVGCDGARSLTRRSLGISYAGEGAARRGFLGGKMCATYFRCPALYSQIAGDRAWMYGAFNRQRRGVMVAINGADEFVFHTQVADDDAITDARAREVFEQALGRAYPIEILRCDPWIAGYTLVAERFGTGRVFLAGDAAHLFTPTGGLGYNTGVEDAVNLGWKLAAVLNGWGGDDLLASYQDERLPIGHRNTRIARGFADSIGKFAVDAAIEEDSPAGETARAIAGDYLAGHARREFNIPGVTFGARYDASGIVMTDAPPPADTINEYHPSGIPGGRAPHVWVNGSESLYDLFGAEFTLLRLHAKADVTSWQHQDTMPVKILDLSLAEEARDLYGADLALIRPDQHIAWRGNATTDPHQVLARALGRVPKRNLEPAKELIPC